MLGQDKPGVSSVYKQPTFEVFTNSEVDISEFESWSNDDVPQYD